MIFFSFSFVNVNNSAYILKDLLDFMENSAGARRRNYTLRL